MAVNTASSLISLQEIKLQPSQSLTNFTTWRVGGPAEWIAEPTTIAEIKLLIAWAKQQQVPCHVIGAGSNLLIHDSGLQGLSICMKKFHGSKLNIKNGLVEASGGEPLPTLARRAAKAGLHGLEWAVGIPGTVGGAAVMNAGAQGSCMAEKLESVLVLPLQGKEPFELKKDELGFAYRKSVLQEEQLIVLSARFKLEPGYDQQELTHITNQNLNHRINTQPYDLPSCGSVFRNPEHLKAGQLIEELGLKGYKIGGAEISKTHANFIVNTGNASAKDISQLIATIQKKVKEAHGLSLHTEVKRLGFELKD